MKWILWWFCLNQNPKAAALQLQIPFKPGVLSWFYQGTVNKGGEFQRYEGLFYWKSMEIACLIPICAFENTHGPALPTALNLMCTPTQAPRSYSTFHTRFHFLSVSQTFHGSWNMSGMFFVKLLRPSSSAPTLHFWGDQIMMLELQKSLLAAGADTFCVL